MKAFFYRLECYSLVHCFLAGGFNRFSADFPEWCESGSDTDTPLDASLLGLETLRITPSNSSPSSSSATSTSSGSESECDSGLPSVVGGGRGPGGGGPLDPPFPVEIVPYLFLGNADNASDFGALERHHIQHILNVTPDLPNAFDKKGLGIRYLQIPIMDHWSQNLAVFFPQAIAFIGESILTFFFLLWLKFNKIIHGVFTYELSWKLLGVVTLEIINPRSMSSNREGRKGHLKVIAKTRTCRKSAWRGGLVIKYYQRR